MFEFFTDPDYIKAIEEERVYFAPASKVNIDRPTWDQCWDILVDQNDNITSIDPVKDRKPRVYVALRAQEDHRIRRFMWKWAETFKDMRERTFTAHLYYGDTDTASLGVHDDAVDVLFWCLHGMVEWRVPKGGQRTHQGDPLLKYDSYTLHPGDVLYVPVALRHQVISIGERFGVSFGSDRNEAYLKYLNESKRLKALRRRVSRRTDFKLQAVK